MRRSIRVAGRQYFVYHQSVNVEHQSDGAVAGIAAAIGEPARTRMLYCLLDGHARTSTELSVVVGVSPSTASVHLARLSEARLVKVQVQGKHRYYSLLGPDVGRALEGLSVLAGGAPEKFAPSTPQALRSARTCYDHIAGSLGVRLHDGMQTLGWLTAPSDPAGDYDLTGKGAKAFESLGVDLTATKGLRRRFAYACLDWSERRPHVGGSLGAALLKIALTRKWLVRDLDSRALEVTGCGRREMEKQFGIRI
jgi:DNA-binding transcriptional ArsR family regulator